MMMFGIIDPERRTYRHQIEAPDVNDALVQAGLTPGKVDHGVLFRLSTRGGIGYVVYEYGMFVPAARQHYFAVGDTLIAGRTVLYEFAENGRTIDLHPDWVIAPRWFSSVEEIEAAIEAGEVRRPQMAVNGEVLWQWPQPAPPDLAEKVTL